MFSLIQTAKENGLNPYSYLTYIFEKAPNLDIHNQIRLLKHVKTNNRWTEDIDKLIFLINEGYNYDIMTDELERTTRAIKDQVYKMFGTRILDKVRLLLKEENSALDNIST